MLYFRHPFPFPFSFPSSVSVPFPFPFPFRFRHSMFKHNPHSGTWLDSKSKQHLITGHLYMTRVSFWIIQQGFSCTSCNPEGRVRQNKTKRKKKLGNRWAWTPSPHPNARPPTATIFMVLGVILYFLTAGCVVPRTKWNLFVTRAEFYMCDFNRRIIDPRYVDVYEASSHESSTLWLSIHALFRFNFKGPSENRSDNA